MDHAPDPAAEDNPSPANPEPQRHKLPDWLEHSNTPQSAPPDSVPFSPPPKPPAVQPVDPGLEPTALPRPGSPGGVPLATTLAETRATLRAMSAGGPRGGYDMDEYRVDAGQAKPQRETDEEPPWVVPEGPETRDPRYGAGAGSPGRLRALEDDPNDRGFKVSWQRRFLDRLRADPRLQLMVLVCLLVVAMTPLFVRKANQTAVSQIRKHAQSYDGQVVTVGGRVGEVFSLGSSHVYYLLQGKDTLVVFTRDNPPMPHQRVTVKGTVSTGYLEGIARVALFDAGS